MEAKELPLMQSVRGIFRRQPGKEKKKKESYLRYVSLRSIVNWFWWNHWYWIFNYFSFGRVDFD